MTTNSATLNGMVVPNGLPTVVWFEWSTDASYGQPTAPVSVGDGMAVVRVSAVVTELASGVAYQFRLVGSNTLGVVEGMGQLFTTAGKPIAWGYNNFGQTNVPSSLSRAVAVASGRSHNLGLSAEGAVVSWGLNSSGQTNVPAGLNNVVALAGGADHSLALTADGSVVAWGSRAYGQANVPSGLSNVVGIAAGDYHSLALIADGTVVSWGRNDSRQTNAPTGLSNVVAVAGGSAHSLALEADGSVVAWGSNSYGQTNVPLGLSNIVAIAAGENHSLALRRDGTVVGWGRNNYGQTNIPSGLSNIVAVEAGADHNLAVKQDGTLVGWGHNNYGQTNVPGGLGTVTAIGAGNDHNLIVHAPKPYAFTQPAQPVTATNAVLNAMATPNGLTTVAWFEWGTNAGYGQATSATNVGDGFGVVRMSAPVEGLVSNSVYHCRLVSSNAAGIAYGAEQLFATGRRAVCWARSFWGRVTPPPGLGDVVSIAAGDYHGLSVNGEGSVSIWGRYDYPPAVDPPPADLSGVVAAAGGSDHSLALKNDGTVVAWGQNYSGQTNVPAGLSNVVAISAGDEHSLALKSDGTLAAWGRMTGGMLATVPAGLTNVVAISSGDNQYLALNNNGTVTKVGDGPTVPTGLKDVVAVSADYVHSLALKSDGTVVGWGDNSAGQITVPTGLSNVVAITSGDRHSIALKSDGTVVAWGYFGFGITNLPVGLSNAVAIDSGDEFGMALAPNVPPQVTSLSVTGAVNVDWPVTLKCVEPNGDPVSYRIVTLPAAGSLFQYAPSGRGSPILTPNTAVSDTQGRVLFAPEADLFGLPYTSFNFLATDGELDSAAATLTMNIIPQPVLTVSSGGGGSGVVSLSFTGPAAAAYRVWATTNLTTWTLLGSASQPEPGTFLFNDASAGDWPWRFYRVSSP